MRSSILIGIGGVLILGCIASLFYKPFNMGTTGLALMIGIVLLAGGMFAKSRRAVDVNNSSVESDT